MMLSCFSSAGQESKDSDSGFSKVINWNNEIIYHVMPRSFYDSNGDLHGDLNGFIEKLDYLEALGVTTILFTPLYESGFYHNYFPTNYESIDQEYGTKADYIKFVKAVHDKGMKFLMDMETQYAQSGNMWFDDSYKNPGSKYSDFIYYSDSLNQYPEQIFMPSKSPLFDFKAWPGITHNIVFLDLNHPNVRQWMSDFYAYWVDPDGDGNFEDGVDGFRIDHIMDDLDYKGLFVNMYRDVWRPIFERCKSINPNLFVLGEQSNWNDYGEMMINESGADAAFNFQLLFALSGEEGAHDMYSEPKDDGVTMDPDRIHKVIEECDKRFSSGTFYVNFLENHDTKRWASVVGGNEGQMRIAGVLNLLLPGIPSIYYGQELGVPGIVGDWGYDVNHIPVREAFPWTTDPEEKGTALWYKDTGEWWLKSYLNNPAQLGQLALSVQKDDPNSLWNHYRKLIELRKKYSAFRAGTYEPINTENSGLMGFRRKYKDEEITVIVNLSNEKVNIEPGILTRQNINVILGDLDGEKGSFYLSPYNFIVLGE